MRKIILIFITLVIASALSIYFITLEKIQQDKLTGGKDKIKNILTERSSDDLDNIIKQGVLRVLVPYNRTDFYLVDGKPTGFQVDLINAYLDHLNKGLSKKISAVFIPTPFDQLIEDLVIGRGDIIASFLTNTPQRLHKISIAFQKQIEIKEVLVTHKSITVQSIEDLSEKKITIMSGGSYREHLNNVNQTNFNSKEPIDIDIADRSFNEIDILEMINIGIVDMTVIDEYKANYWIKQFPNIKIHSDIIIEGSNQAGWAVRKNNPELFTSTSEFLNSIKKGTFIGNFTYKKYYKNSKRIKSPLFKKLSKEKSNIITLITKYAEEYKFNPSAVIAQAYQESYLDQSKVSHRGAIGVMQILPSTGEDMGFNDVSNLEDNIHAGIKYLAFIRDTYIANLELDKKNEYAFLWAAYNAGPKRIPKFRAHAETLGYNSNIWFSNTEYAVLEIIGNETVDYVANIYKYYIIYQRLEELNKNKDLFLFSRKTP